MVVTLLDGGHPNRLVDKTTTTKDNGQRRQLKGAPRQTRDQYPRANENSKLEEEALLKLGLIDIQIIATYDTYVINPIQQPLTPVSDPFWAEFNEWRINNPNEYEQWLNDRNLPAPDNADAQDATGATGYRYTF